MKPSVPEDQLASGGWSLREEVAETLFRLPTARVEGHTLLYEDAAPEEGVQAVTDRDRDRDLPRRFFFATRLSFSPPLGPGIGPAMVLPTVASEARRAFADDLADRGFRGIDRGRSQRLRTEAGDRARLTKYTARYGVERDGSAHRIDIEAWIAVWVHDGTFRLAGGAYPTRGLADLLEAADSNGERSGDGKGPGTSIDYPNPAAAREELLGLIRAVR